MAHFDTTATNFYKEWYFISSAMYIFIENKLYVQMYYTYTIVLFLNSNAYCNDYLKNCQIFNYIIRKKYNIIFIIIHVNF
jgi:hypothetical protein